MVHERAEDDEVRHSHGDRFIHKRDCPACNPPWPETDRWGEGDVR